MNGSTAPMALIVGARGGWGHAMSEVLIARGWRVRALVRGPVPDGGASAGDDASQQGVTWVSGDALQPADVMRAAQGVQVVVHAVNPPGYVRWEELALPMLRSSMAAAQDQGARLMMPGNVYNFGPDAGQVVAETAPQHPLTRKGQVRVRMEDALQEAAARHGLRSLVMRCGDFFGGTGPSSWFNTVLVKPGRPVRRIIDPHERGAGHAWAYLPDAALATALCLELALREPGRLATAERLHLQGHDLRDGRELAQAVARVVRMHTGRQPRVTALPWGLMSLLAPLSPMLREVREMRYLWQQPLTLDNSRLLALLGQEPHTPLDEAVAVSLARMGCLPTVPQAALAA